MAWIGFLLLSTLSWTGRAQMVTNEVREIGNWPGHRRGVAENVFVTDQRAYVAIGEGGVVILDVSNPDAAVRLGGFDTSGIAYDVQVAGTTAYVADHSSGLQILDVSDPAAVVYLGGFDTSGIAYDVQVAGTTAYVADERAGLAILDVSDPAAVVHLGSFDTSGYAVAVQVVDTTAYVADYFGGLQILGVSNPAAVVRLGGFGTRGNAQAVQTVGATLYLTDDSAGLHILDVAAPGAVVRLGGYDTGGSAGNLQVVGTTAYVADGPAGLQVLDVSNPAMVVRVGAFDVGGFASAVQVLGTSAFVADRAAGLRILDVSNPAAAVRLGIHVTSGSAENMHVVGTIAYVADRDAGLQILDLRAPPAVVQLGGFDTPGSAEDVQVVGTTAYVADGSAGLQILDVSNPTAVVRLGGFGASLLALDVQVVGTTAYVADPEAGLLILDASNPAAVVPLGGYDTGGYARRVYVAGTTAYVADDWAGLLILDVSSPGAVVRLGRYHTSGYAGDVQVVGTTAYVADSFAGLEILDVSNPGAVVHLGRSDIGGSAIRVQVDGRAAYLAVGDAGLQILDVSNPAAVVHSGGYDTRGHAYGVQVVGTTAYVADGEWGLTVLELRPRFTQSITFPALGSVTVTNTPIRLDATASSGLALNFQVLSGPGHVEGHTLFWTSPGLVVVRAEQPGNELFAPVAAERTLTVLPSAPAAPGIQRQPSPLSLAVGQPGALSVIAASGTPAIYQWRLNGQDIPGATNDTYAIPAFRLDDAGTYTVVVANDHGSLESDPAQLSPSGIPLLELVDAFADRRLFAQDSFTGVTNTLAATFESPDEPRHAGKTGGRSLWLTWRPRVSGVATLSTAGSGFDTLLAVYTGSALTALAEVASDEDRGGYLTSALSFNAIAATDYHIAIDGFAGAAGELILSGNLLPGAPPLPEITQSPQSLVAAGNAPVTLSVVSPTAGATFQWSRNGSPLAGATQPSLAFTATPDRAGTYRARVTSADGFASVESADAFVEVVPAGLPAPVVGETVSADKWPDLFADDPAGPQLHGPPALMGFTSVSLGLGGRYTDLTSIASGGASTHNATDPRTCGAVTGVTRWLRFRVTRNRGVALQVSDSEVPVLLGVFEVAGTSAADRALESRGCAFGGLTGRPGRLAVYARQQVDYLVMVSGSSRGGGSLMVSWDGSEELELTEPGLGFKDGRPLIEWIVAPGRYDILSAEDVLDWVVRLQTNAPGALLRYHEPDPVIHPARYYELHHLPGGP